jgi:16S rRNA (guanine527-N7)-methyltransferase
MMNPGVELIFKYFPNLTELQQKQFAQLGDLYTEWNAKINVVSRKDMDKLYLHHVLHALAMVKVVKFVDGANIMDLGTGGGFPAVPLAIYYPNVNFLAVDSIGKKITVVNEVSQAIGLKNLTAINDRAENIKQKFDFVVSRAVAPTDKLMGWINKSISKNQQHALPNGLLAYKGGNVDAELRPYKKYASIYEIHDFFKEEFFETKKIVYVQG